MHTRRSHGEVQKIRAAPLDAAPILAIRLPFGRNRYRLLATYAAPVFSSASAARMTTPFNALSFSNRQVGASLLGHLGSDGHVSAGAELQGAYFLAAAGAESNSGDHRREYDRGLHVHGLLSYHVSAIALSGYRAVALRSRTQLLIQRFSTPVDAKMPLELLRIG
jgi:hypothetical protein